MIELFPWLGLLLLLAALSLAEGCPSWGREWLPVPAELLFFWGCLALFFGTAFWLLLEVCGWVPPSMQ